MGLSSKTIREEKEDNIHDKAQDYTGRYNNISLSDQASRHGDFIQSHMPEHFRQDATEGLPEDVAEEAQENRFKGQV